MVIGPLECDNANAAAKISDLWLVQSCVGRRHAKLHSVERKYADAAVATWCQLLL